VRSKSVIIDSIDRIFMPLQVSSKSRHVKCRRRVPPLLRFQSVEFLPLPLAVIGDNPLAKRRLKGYGTLPGSNVRSDKYSSSRPSPSSIQASNPYITRLPHTYSSYDTLPSTSPSRTGSRNRARIQHCTAPSNHHTRSQQSVLPTVMAPHTHTTS